MALAIAVLFLLTILPSRYSMWTNWFGNVADFVLAPIQWPLNLVVGVFKRSGEGANSRDPVIAALERERDKYKDAYYRTLGELDQSRTQMAAMTRGMQLNNQLPFKLLPAPVIGSVFDGASQLLRIRAGAKNGVTEGSVVAVEGVDLLGRIPIGGVADRISKVLPIIDRGARPISVLIFPGEMAEDLASDPAAAAAQLPVPNLDPGSAIAAQLTPTGLATLSGPVEAPRMRADYTPPRPAVGMLVRLRDLRWPASAQMLIVGRITMIDTQSNGRQIITVTPRYVLPVADVLVRVSGDDVADAAANGGRQ